MDYSRIEEAVDIKLLQNTHIVGVGAGGAYSLYEGLVRSGIGKLTVLDFDSVDDVNLCRQGFKPEEIGLDKVDALGSSLLSINPDFDYLGLPWNIMELSDEELDTFVGDADLFLFMTDSFKAQAFGNELALKYKKPAIWGGYYEKSQCAEIIFYIPDVTPACFRCITPSRYEAQSKETINVSSKSNTIFHSMLIDSLIGKLALAILHNNTTGYDFSGYFGRRFDRNLIQFKVNPDYDSRLFDSLYHKSEGKTVLYNAIWQQIHTEGCPDCYEIH